MCKIQNWINDEFDQLWESLNKDMVNQKASRIGGDGSKTPKAVKSATMSTETHNARAAEIEFKQKK